MDKTPLTARGAELLRQELKQLKSVERPRIVEAIATARAHGDLKENAEYHAAKEQQGLMEARIRDIEAKLSNAQVIDVTQLPKSGRVVFGATVQLADVESGDEAKYRIVGEDEADIKSGLMSVSSPIARALIGKEEGDTVDVTTPGGAKTYEIVEVEYI
jgi:transcription elongation factor GreA